MKQSRVLLPCLDTEHFTSSVHEVAWLQAFQWRSFIAKIERLANLERVGQALADALRIPNAVHSKPRGTGLSTLNDNGAPVQACLQLTRKGACWFLLGDPDFDLNPPMKRLESGRQVLNDLLAKYSDSALPAMVDSTLRTCLPIENPDCINTLNRGVIWVAGVLGGPGFATYVETRHGTPQQDWERASRWMCDNLAFPDEALSAIQSIKQYATLAGIGVKGRSTATMRLKLYWRLNAPVSMAALDVALLHHAALPFFLSRLVGERALPISALTFSTAFHAVSGALSDVKVDVCCCPQCLNQTTAHLLDVINGCVDAFDLSPLPVTLSDIDDDTCSPALLGLGVDRKNDVRINLYLKPKAGYAPSNP